ncbi:MAG: universal stress protein [Deltaproteobacteria bacterium]|nr:MAG: universal stress protein [Deltaproteobacteria bacterium]
MNYRNLLVHLDQGERSNERFNLALELAGRFGARLSLYYGTPFPFVGQESERRLRAGLLAECRARAEAVRVDLEWRDDADVLVHQPLLARLNYQAFFADLTIVGQPAPGNGGESATPKDLPERLILTSGRPVLTVPYAGEFERVGSRVMVAWRTGRASSRALLDSLPLLAGAESVHLLSFVTSRGELPLAGEAMKRLKTYLSAHGVEAESEVRMISNIGFGDALLNRMTDEAVDLLVAGGPLPTAPAPMAAKVLREMTVPVLMSS